MKLRELSEFSEHDTFIIIDEFQNENDSCYMAAWERIEANYLFDENLNPIEI